MKQTPYNKDHIARLISAKAYSLPVGEGSDALSNDMARISAALTSMGEPGSPFRSLADFQTTRMPPSMDKHHDAIPDDRSYLDVLKSVLPLIKETA
tara:strand:+ start:141 stop:428 length:288 start_codon:yes stop_codon:yes gene_type:complete